MADKSFFDSGFIPAAPWYVLLLARLYGARFRETSVDGVVEGYLWRGKLYITSWNPASAGGERG